MILKPAPTQASVGSRAYWVLAVVDSHTKSKKNGEMISDYQPSLKAHPQYIITIHPTLNFFSPDPRLDKDARAMVPKWSHSPEEMLVDQAEYDLAAVPLTSISLVTARTIKVKRRSIQRQLWKLFT